MTLVGWGDFKRYHILAIPWAGLAELLRRMFVGEYSTIVRDFRGVIICLAFAIAELVIVAGGFWLLMRLF